MNSAYSREKCDEKAANGADSSSAAPGILIGLYLSIKI